MLVAFALHLICKCVLAVEASRRFMEDRRSGALELLLVTPLSPAEIVASQLAALRAQFRGAVVGLLAVNVVMFLMTLAYQRQLHMNSDDQWIFFEIFGGGFVLLLFDFSAIRWTAMLAALRHQKQYRAMLASVGKLLVIPWIVMAVVMFARPRMNDVGVATFLGCWFVLGIVIDMVAGQRARILLLGDFRAMAAK